MGVYALLKDKFPWLEMEENFSLARHTTIGCGGSVSVAVSPSDAEEAAEILSFLSKQKIPHAFLGAGANTLPFDEDSDGVLIRTNALKGIISDGDRIFAGAGVTGGALLRYAKSRQIGGYEFLAGIPTTVGGACVMNAGVKEKHFSEIAVRVLAVSNGKIRSFPLLSCKFGEKESIFQDGIFVAGVLLKAEHATEKQIGKKTADFLFRRKNLPKGRSMGCTFVNPNGRSAGEIIDECGLKGMRVGHAVVSERHANFIINEGGTASDISLLISAVKQKVFEKTGILLREEIKRLSFREDT